MIRGLRKKWKQPVSYYFCKGTTSTLTLTNLITDVITAVNEAGFKVRAGPVLGVGELGDRPGRLYVMGYIRL